MLDTETLHAQPHPGKWVSPCCGRSLDQLPQYDRITLDPEAVTCGRLSDTDMAILSGQPAITDPDSDRVVFSMASTVCRLSEAPVSLREAYSGVQTAIREILPANRVLEHWSADLMVRVTERAQQLTHR